jgi:hypothetical protein
MLSIGRRLAVDRKALENTELRSAVMNRRLTMFALVVFPLFFAACSTTSTKTDDTSTMTDESKLGTLASSLGITAQQAQGGLGAMLVIAKQRLANENYLRIVKYIPEADEYVGVARQLSVFEGATSTATALDAAFSKLGMTPEQQAKFIAAVTDYLTKAGGRDVGNLMTGALK